MYIIDKLELLQQTSNIQSIEYELSKYLLTHLSNIEKKNLKEISIETKISQASIIRFCQKIGYKGVTQFINDLYLETSELNSKLQFFNAIDLKVLDTMKDDFFKECKHNISLCIKEVCRILKESHKIMFYGQKDFINCFQYLISYCYLNQKEVITSMSLSKENQKDLFDTLTEIDCLIVIDPYINWNTYKELTFIQNDTINNINKTSAKIIYIGQESLNDVDICLSLPYTYYDYFYKMFFNQLDMMLTLNLKELEQ